MAIPAVHGVRRGFGPSLVTSRPRSVSAICRQCRTSYEQRPPGRCKICGTPRFVSHDELHELSIAHLDCDAFYATVEKRDNPSLAERPVVVGGRKRGVVAACCYIARTHGLHSAMPMYQALKLCPDAVVIPPDMAKYQRVGREVRKLMQETTPLVEPLSVDEAFLDLTGTTLLHNGSPAQTLVRLVHRIESEIGVTASVGLSYNKFLAKTASDLDKPRGFAVIGRLEALSFLALQPVGTIWGVGTAMQRRLERDGFRTIGQLRSVAEKDLIVRYGAIGQRLAHLSRGLDTRRVNPNAGAKSISTETTFTEDIVQVSALAHRLWPLCEKVAKRLKNASLLAGGITLKIKTSQFQNYTRSRRLSPPTQLAESIYRAALPLLDELVDGRRFRLIGIGTTQLVDTEEESQLSMLGEESAREAKIADAVNAVRERFGDPAILKGRNLVRPLK